MIRIAAVLDTEFRIVPFEQVLALPTLANWVERIYESDAAIVGKRSLNSLSERLPKLRVLTHDASFKLGKAKTETAMEPLVTKYLSSADEAVVVGGATIFSAFLPHSAVLDLAIVNGVTGVQKFDTWNDGSFDLVDQNSLDGFETRRLFRL
jgi:dihydrofolate reductase